MSEMTEVKTTDLTCAALDWAVGQAEGVSVKILPADNPEERWQVQRGGLGAGPYWPSQDWSQGGPLIEKLDMAVCRAGEHGWMAWEQGNRCEYADTHARAEICGPTALIAACRVIVATKLGMVVRIPAELI